jgi:hypothetical protein
VTPGGHPIVLYLVRLKRSFWYASLFAAMGRAPSYQNPCAARPGFETSAARRYTKDGPGVVHVRAPTKSADVLDTLRAVSQALREAPVDRATDVRVDIPLTFFAARSCAEIFAAFDAADFCLKKPRQGKIPFYRLPPNSAGGGRELILHFDERGYCDGAHWCFTQ